MKDAGPSTIAGFSPASLRPPVNNRADASTATRNLSVDDLSREVTELLSKSALSKNGIGALTLLDTRDVPNAHLITDYVTKWLVRDKQGRPSAVVLCSSPTSSKLVERGMSRARSAKALLGNELGRVIMTPIQEGEVQGLSYTVLPYAQPLSSNKLWRKIQRHRVIPGVLEWLRGAAEKTKRDPSEREREDAFIEPLRHLSQHDAMPEAIRSAAADALQRLRNGQWTPVHVLMHGDFWDGNILIDVNNVTGRAGSSWPNRFVVIDWPGALLQGYGFFDLIRFARATGLSVRQLKGEVHEHCRIIGCEISDAPAHLLAGLGYLELHRERFPLEHFTQMAVNCLDTLTIACRS